MSNYIFLTNLNSMCVEFDTEPTLRGDPEVRICVQKDTSSSALRGSSGTQMHPDLTHEHNQAASCKNSFCGFSSRQLEIVSTSCYRNLVMLV